MFSLIRDVLMPAAPALALIAALVMAPPARAHEGPNEEKIAAAGTDDMAADTPDARPCRRIERIGKVTIRRCQ